MSDNGHRRSHQNTLAKWVGEQSSTHGVGLVYYYYTFHEYLPVTDIKLVKDQLSASRDLMNSRLLTYDKIQAESHAGNFARATIGASELISFDKPKGAGRMLVSATSRYMDVGPLSMLLREIIKNEPSAVKLDIRYARVGDQKSPEMFGIGFIRITHNDVRVESMKTPQWCEVAPMRTVLGLG